MVNCFVMCRPHTGLGKQFLNKIFLELSLKNKNKTEAEEPHRAGTLNDVCVLKKGKSLTKVLYNRHK